MTKHKTITAKSEHILVVDDEPDFLSFLEWTLKSAGYRVTAFSSSKNALAEMKRHKFDLACIDINMPEINGIELTKRILVSGSQAEILIMTGVPTEDVLDPLLKMGVVHYVFKPFDKVPFLCSVYAALHHYRLRQELLSGTPVSRARNSGIVGVSISSRDLRQEIFGVAELDIPVLVLGESGTGKEIVSTDIHMNSLRKEKNLLPVNCATLGTLAESELFGHASGAFTGANRSTNGYVGSADGGTLFLDEIGELPAGVQASLLRFLDSGEYSRVGDSKVRKADVRIIAATNRNIDKMLRQGTFRDDLYYRLAGAVIKTSPLRERKTDIPPLIWHFLEIFGAAKNRTFTIAPEAITVLMKPEWPGNVRELKQTLYKICQQAIKSDITLADVSRIIGTEEGAPEKTLYRQAKEQCLNGFDQAYFSEVLAQSNGSLKRALELTGMHKKNLYTKLKQLGMKVKDYKLSTT